MGAVPGPQNRCTPRTPLTMPSKMSTAQVEPASTSPSNVTVLWQLLPSAGPVALSLSGPGAGVDLIPGEIVNVPVGSAGVPPQIQLVAACAGAAPHPTARD